MIDQTSELEREDEFNHPNTTTVGTQTDLTAEDISKLEHDYQKKTDEVSGLRGTKGFGYPSEDDFKQDEKVLRHYTGLSSYTILMAVFQLVSAVLLEGGAAKLTKFK